ncbi:general secretion pathway protein GspN [Pseudomonas sp. BP8]|uniref:general secretion pathway protein GspN n=1 Tax=Pseudomonas sp. BP8 TaxID=2817864 RepID=UPI001AE0EFE5|nr:general secretion pathway protein GspN [Pseudomonas sp. BP8]MBP2260774.1 general secretion pathway protein N [Pseudomonas sp. BP8]HDS1735489.1 general secretion pathway protein GspN [Pseudomonas putida]
MSWRSGLWLALVFAVSVLAQLPARWVGEGLGLSAKGVSGSLWRGQATQWGEVGPVSWQLRPWRLDAEARLGFQGQGWQARVHGWPWRWQGQLEALAAQTRVASGYRLAGQWQGVLRMKGAGWGCSAAEGRIAVEDLALVEPWSLGLGRAAVEMDCRQGWRLLARLEAPGQHQGVIDADLLGRRAQLSLDLHPDAALTPLLRGAQLIGPQASRMQRQVSW